MRSAQTTISCRFIARTAAAIALLIALAVAAHALEPNADGHVLPMASRWSVDVAGAPAAEPVSDARQVYLALKAGQVVARALSDGAEKWRRDNLATAQPLGLDGSHLFVVAGAAIHALRTADGRDDWIKPDLTPTAPLLAEGGWVIAATASGLVALRGSDGAIVWQRKAGTIRERPTIDGDRLYFSLEDGRMTALQLESGEPIWEQQLGGAPGAVYVSHGRVYAGGSDKYFYCLRADTGELLWEWRVGATFQGRPSGDEDHVYVAALDNIVRAFDRANGALRWKVALPERPASGPIVAGTTVFVPAVASEVWAFNARTGARQGGVPVPERLAVPPELVERAGVGLFAFAITGGLTNEWKLTLLATTGDPPVVPLSTLPGTVLPPER